MNALPRPDARATAAGYTWSAQVGRPGGCLMAQVWAPDNRSVATIEPTEDPAVASRRAELCALAMADAERQLADPLDTPLPCDVVVGHGTMRKGVPLRALVTRMKVLYEMATGQNADTVAARTPGKRAGLLAQFLRQIADPAQAEPLPAGERQVYEQLLTRARTVIATIEPESLAEHEQLQQLIAGIDAVTDPVARQDLFTGGA